MKPRGILLLAGLAGLLAPAAASVLGNLASALGPRKWMIMPTNASLGALNLHYSLLFWNDSGVWDPVGKKIHWVGGPGTCCANPADYKRITYDVEGDTWSLSNTPFSGSGHAYDANAFDPGAGLHYFALIGSRAVRALSGNSWNSLPDAPFSSTTPSLTWFPDINGGKGGLVFLGDNGNLAWYDGSKWNSLSSVGLSGYNGFSQYNPALKSVWLGGCGSRSNYLLSAALTSTKLPDAPFSLANGSTMHTCDPAEGAFLVYNHDTDFWWRLDNPQGAWTQASDMSPKFSLASAFHVPIPEYGIVFVFSHASSSKYSYIYRHATSPAAAEQRTAEGPFRLRIAPNPVRGEATLFHPPGRVAIHTPAGRRVAAFLFGQGTERARWNARDLPAGVYLVRSWSKYGTVDQAVTVLK